MGSVSNSAINDCYNTGRIYASSRSNAYAGGITGSSDLITNCYNIGEVIATSTGSFAPFVMVGGIAGDNHGRITNCFHLDNVTNGIEAPGVYLARLGVATRKNDAVKHPCCWSPATVASILRKLEYVGHCGRRILSNRYFVTPAISVSAQTVNLDSPTVSDFGSMKQQCST